MPEAMQVLVHLPRFRRPFRAVHTNGRAPTVNAAKQTNGSAERSSTSTGNFELKPRNPARQLAGA
jgi:hypothetical protein